MKIKNVKLEWYILQHDFNDDKMIMYNIFHDNSPEIIAKKIRKGAKDNWIPVTNYNSFKDYIKQELMYNYWSKCEREFLACGLFKSKTYKIDGWFQLEPNLDNIVNYIIEKMKIKFK